MFNALFYYVYYLVSSKADCLPDAEGLCTPGVTIEEQVTVEKTEEDKGTEIIFTTTTTKTTTTTTVTNEDSGDILDGDNGYVATIEKVIWTTTGVAKVLPICHQELTVVN